MSAFLQDLVCSLLFACFLFLCDVAAGRYQEARRSRFAESLDNKTDAVQDCDDRSSCAGQGVVARDEHSCSCRKPRLSANDGDDSALTSWNKRPSSRSSQQEIHSAELQSGSLAVCQCGQVANHRPCPTCILCRGCSRHSTNAVRRKANPPQSTISTTAMPS